MAVIVSLSDHQSNAVEDAKANFGPFLRKKRNPRQRGGLVRLHSVPLFGIDLNFVLSSFRERTDGSNARIKARHLKRRRHEGDWEALASAGGEGCRF